MLRKPFNFKAETEHSDFPKVKAWKIVMNFVSIMREEIKWPKKGRMIVDVVDKKIDVYSVVTFKQLVTRNHHRFV